MILSGITIITLLLACIVLYAYARVQHNRADNLAADNERLRQDMSSADEYMARLEKEVGQPQVMWRAHEVTSLLHKRVTWEAN